MDKEENKAKSLKLGKNDIICPSCHAVLTISDDIKKDELIQCSKCEAAFNNPFFFSGKFIICRNCGNNAELPKDLENELILNCGECGQEFFNPYSYIYNPIVCPHCFIETHVPEEVIQERYLQCPNCMNVFKNTLRQRKNNISNKLNLKNSNLKQNEIVKSDNSIVGESMSLTKNQRNWILGIVMFVFVLIIGYTTNDSSSTSSNTLYTVNTTTYVATSKSSFNEMFRYINDRDNQALSKLMSYGEVQTLSAGTKVNLISSHISYCVVRRQGSTSKLWVVTEHITKD